ncbi:MAG: arginine--tRNA ligase [Lentisphaeria bacterium]|nr:arginine--tRNA ligase [Lentisphaeria bacterium]
MKFKLVADLEKHLTETYGQPCPEIVTECPPPDMTGDITVNCFRLTKPLRANPMAVAAEAARFLSTHADARAAESVKAFVNIVLEPVAVFRDAVADPAGLLNAVLLPEGERRRIVIEFSAPNTNKPQHLGHVRNNTLGQAVASILSKVGHDVIPVNLVNDRGIHICKSMLAYHRFGDGVTPATAHKKGDHLVGDFYVRYDRELTRQLEELRAARPDLADKSNEDLFSETEIGKATQDMLIAWENGDPDVRALWGMMNAWVFEGFAETYARMGIEFEKTYLESDTYTLGKGIVEDGLKKGVFQKREDGAAFIDLTQEKLDTKVVLRSDGTSVYITQDLGTTLLKQDEFQPDQQIWVVGDEQIYHFRVLFAILKRLGYPWADNLVHMAYGMVNLPSGKMKSREGKVVDADDLFDEMERLARTATLERCEEAPEDLDLRARVLGMAALKFMLLKVNPKTTLMFDPEASVKFEGDTGPYVLYAYARICSMFRKATADALSGEVDWSLLQAPEELGVALQLAEYGHVMRKAAQDFDTSGLAGYLLELAKAFSRFYRECSVLSAESAELRRARLALSDRVRSVLRDGLQSLTIGTLESM